MDEKFRVIFRSIMRAALLTAHRLRRTTRHVGSAKTKLLMLLRTYPEGNRGCSKIARAGRSKITTIRILLLLLLLLLYNRREHRRIPRGPIARATIRI